MKTQLIPLKTLSLHSWSILDPRFLVKHHAQLILLINLHSWVVITLTLPYAVINSQEHRIIYCNLMYTLT